MTDRRRIRKCDKCSGTGTYSWGASVNGVMQHSGVCFACRGKGVQTTEDVRRNQAYWRFAVRSAF